MKKKVFEWRLHQQENRDQIVKYCPHCNRKVIFTDSQKRRRNANGKNIHEYAIYKCEKAHTWNRKLTQKKSCQIRHPANSQPRISVVPDNELINIPLLKQQGYGVVEIVLVEVKGRWRLDVLLAENIVGMSRSRIKKLMEKQSVAVGNSVRKPGAFVKKDQVIVFFDIKTGASNGI